MSFSFFPLCRSFAVRSFLKIVIGILIVFSLVSCRKKIVETSYASIGQKSINGIDALRAVLQANAKTFFESSFLTKRARQEADLIVFVEREPERYPPDFFLHLEAWLTGQSLIEAFSEKSAKNSGGKQETTPKNKDPNKTKGKYKTLMYFLRDTTANLPFFERLYDDLQGHPRKQNYVDAYLQESAKLRSNFFPTGELPFGNRFVFRPKGPLLRRPELVWDSRAFPEGVSSFPVRVLSTPPAPNYASGELQFQTLLSSREGETLIREFFFPKARLILIYNTEPFLNYSLVQKANQRLLEQLLDYALTLPDAPTPITEPVIANIRYAPIPPVRAEKEEDVFSRVFLVYPINLLAVSVVLFMIFFLLSRWPHEKRPLPESPVGNRSFLEHFQALGVRLERSKDRQEVLERLLAFKKASRNLSKTPQTREAPAQQTTHHESDSNPS